MLRQGVGLINMSTTLSSKLLCSCASRLVSSTAQFSSSSLCSSQDVPPATKDPQTFHRASHGEFYQTPPQLYNTLIEDPFLRECLSQRLPADVKQDVFSDLTRLGARVSSELDPLGRQAEENPPQLQQYDPWGRRVDQLITSQAWKRMHHVSAEEGFVGVAYERRHAQWSRLHQFAKLYLYAASSGLYSCPLAMTDAAAGLIETVKEPLLMERAYPRLVSRDPDMFWTSGQWMTERGGGSDVAGGTDTVAVPCDTSSHTHHLYGYKWFSSATDADMAFTLARVQDDCGRVTQGTSGLSLFYVETRTDEGKLNNILIQSLKNKLGTRQLPTAELLLDGTAAMIVGEHGRGISGISTMLTITRLHNCIAAVSAMRRMMQLSRDYATKRRAFGQYLISYPLHMRTLGQLEIETRGCTLLTLTIAELLGREECGVSNEEESLLLRLLVPVAKLYTAKQAVSLVSEGLESFGGQGYIETTGLPTAYRDAQVLPIWEGTTNILSLDVLRALQKTKGEALQALAGYVKRQTSSPQPAGLQHVADSIAQSMLSLSQFFLSSPPPVLTTAARDFANSIAHVTIGCLLLEKAIHKDSTPLDAAVAERWCSRPLPLKPASCYQQATTDLHLVMDGHKLSLDAD